MRTVWKYESPVIDEATGHLIPEGAKLLFVGMQEHGLQAFCRTVCLWLEVDSDAEKVMRKFKVVGTGHEVPDAMEYCGSVIDGQSVWHVYEEANHD